MKSFTDYPVNHLKPEMVDELEGARPLSEMSPQQRDLAEAKVEVHKTVLMGLVQKSNLLMRSIFSLVEQDALPIQLATGSLITGMAIGYALGVSHPSTEADNKEFEKAVMELMDRRSKPCEDPTCLACQLKKLMQEANQKPVTLQ